MIQTTPIISRARVYKTPNNNLNITQSSGSDSGLKHTSHPESWYTESSSPDNKSANNSHSSYSSDDEASQSNNKNQGSNKFRKKFQSWKQKITGNTPKKVVAQRKESIIPSDNSNSNSNNSNSNSFNSNSLNNTLKNIDNSLENTPENNKNTNPGIIFSQKRSINYIDSSVTSSMTSVCDNQNADLKEYLEIDIPVGRFGNLGITVIGQTTPEGHDVGIYCGGIIQNSAAASIGGLIQVGDRLVMVDGEDLRHMPNDYAVEVLQQRVTNCLLGRSPRSSITVGLAKYMDQRNSQSSSESESSDSATENLDSSNEENINYGIVKPINPAEWVANHEDFYLSQSQLHKSHLLKVQKIQQARLNGHQANLHLEDHYNNTPSSVTDSDGDILTVSEERESCYDTLCYDPQVASHKKLLNSLSIQTSMRTMVKTAGEKGSGLKIKDREWLRMMICNAFLGADLVDWLHENVSGLEDRRDAKQYASTLFKGQLVRPTIQARLDKFSEKSYYKF